MALDAKELQQLAALLGEVLAPRIREAVAENVSVRVDAFAHTIREEQKGMLDALKASTEKSLAEASEAIRKDVSELALASAGTSDTKAAAHAAQLSEKIGTLQESLSTRIEEINLSVNKDIIDVIDKLVKVEASIPVVPPFPEIPAPTKLLDGGELSAEMRAAMDVAVRHVFQPMVGTALTPVMEQLNATQTRIEVLNNTSDTVIAELKDGIISIGSTIQSFSETTEAKLAAQADRIAAESLATASLVEGTQSWIDKAITEVNTRVTEVNILADEKLASVAEDLCRVIGDAKSTVLDDAKQMIVTVKEAVEERVVKVIASLSAVEEKTATDASDLRESIAAAQTSFAASTTRAEETKAEIDAAIKAIRESTSESLAAVAHDAQQAQAVAQEVFRELVSAAKSEISTACTTLDKRIDETNQSVIKVNEFAGDCAAKIDSHTNTLRTHDASLAAFHTTVNAIQTDVVVERETAAEVVGALRVELSAVNQTIDDTRIGLIRYMDDAEKVLRDFATSVSDNAKGEAKESISAVEKTLAGVSETLKNLALDTSTGLAAKTGAIMLLEEQTTAALKSLTAEMRTSVCTLDSEYNAAIKQAGVALRETIEAVEVGARSYALEVCAGLRGTVENARTEDATKHAKTADEIRATVAALDKKHDAEIEETNAALRKDIAVVNDGVRSYVDASFNALRDSAEKSRADDSSSYTNSIDEIHAAVAALDDFVKASDISAAEAIAEVREVALAACCELEVRVVENKTALLQVESTVDIELEALHAAHKTTDANVAEAVENFKAALVIDKELQNENTREVSERLNAELQNLKTQLEGVAGDFSVSLAQAANELIKLVEQRRVDASGETQLAFKQAAELLVRSIEDAEHRLTKLHNDALNSAITSTEASIKERHGALADATDTLSSDLNLVISKLSRLETSTPAAVDAVSARLDQAIKSTEAIIHKAAESSAAQIAALQDSTSERIVSTTEAMRTALAEEISASRAEILKSQSSEVEAVRAGIREAEKTSAGRLAVLRELTSEHVAATTDAVRVALTEEINVSRAEILKLQSSSFEAVRADVDRVANASAEQLVALQESTAERIVNTTEAVRMALTEELHVSQRHILKNQAEDSEALRRLVAETYETGNNEIVQIVVELRANQQALESLGAELPRLVVNEVAKLESPMIDAAKAAAESLTVGLFEANAPQIEELARVAAVGAVPAAVAAQTEGLPESLGALLVPLAVREATRVATEAGEAATGAARVLGEAAIVAARGEAADTARAAATEAAKALRDELFAALDPTERIAKAISDSLPAEVRASVKEAIETVEPRLFLQLAAKVQGEVDRIPRPRDGTNGTKGTDGTNGKDARVAVPVPYEYGKRYEFGAWVAHSNGIWVAARNTDSEPLAESSDWDCVTPGIRNIESVLQEDGRTIEVHFELTNGALHKSVVKLPIQIPRGVYDVDKVYDVHDIVTFDGSQWVAQKDGKLPRPGTDPAWKLSVKHGRDGKDLKQAPAAIIRKVGAWEPDTLYEVNQVVEHAGVHWLALRSNRERPPFTTLVSNDTWLKLGS